MGKWKEGYSNKKQIPVSKKEYFIEIKQPKQQYCKL